MSTFAPKRKCKSASWRGAEQADISLDLLELQKSFTYQNLQFLKSIYQLRYLRRQGTGTKYKKMWPKIQPDIPETGDASLQARDRILPTTVLETPGIPVTGTPSIYLAFHSIYNR